MRLDQHRDIAGDLRAGLQAGLGDAADRDVALRARAHAEAAGVGPRGGDAVHLVNEGGDLDRVGRQPRGAGEVGARGAEDVHAIAGAAIVRLGARSEAGGFASALTLP
jgi:hypothetical protein